MTQALAWAGLALFAYFLLTRLRTLAVLVGMRRGLSEAAAVRIRPSRIAVETLVIVVVLGLWVNSALDRGHLDWEVGGSGSPLHLELAGAWFAIGAAGLVAAMTALLAFTGTVAFARASDLRAQFPRSAVEHPYALRLPTMNPDVVFAAPRRSPLLWAWTEVRAGAVGVITTLAMEALDRNPTTAGTGLGETIDEASEEFELERRLGRGERALTWNELLTPLAKATDAASFQPDRLILPPVALSIGGRALGYWAGLLSGVLNTRRVARREANLAKFDERTSLRRVLGEASEPLGLSRSAQNLDCFLDHVRGRVFDDLKRQLSPRLSRQLAKAYRRGYMEEAAAWMIERVPNYPELFQRAVHAELDKQAGLAASVLSRIEQLQDQEDADRLGT